MGSAMRRHACMLVLCLAPAAGATDFYVDPVSGSNGGDGSPNSPWRTLQAVIEANLIETRDWESLPYHPGLNLVTVNPGAPVKAGDTLWLRSGYHGEIEIRSAYNALPITIAAQPGQVPLLRSLRVRSAQNWVLRGLSISPSHAPPLDQITIVDVSDDGYFGPAWDIDVDDCDVFSVADASGWSATDWVDLASNGVDVGADRVTIRNCRLRNVRFGIGVGGRDAIIRGDLIDGFSGDGLRGLGDNGLFEYNRVQNNYIGDPPDPNHDDGFQSWSVGPGGVGTGEVRGVTLRGNVFINALDPNNPLRSSMQAIGCFDGFFVDWVVENNVVITDHWHGISFYGMRDSRIVNNTVIDLEEGQPGPPWIMVTDHKNGTPSQNVVVRNNLATDFSIEGINVVEDHNILFTHAEAATLFLAPPFDLHLRAGTAAVDTGSPDLAPPFDAEGVPRPQGAGFDLGAYERFVPTLAIGDASVVEGDSGTTSAVFAVTLSLPAPSAVTVNFASADGTASAGVDYQAVSGALTFAPGSTLRTVTVPVLGDHVDEDDETFVVNLAGATGATLGDAQGLGTIQDNDPPPVMAIGDCAVAEGDAGGQSCTLAVGLSAPSSHTVTASFATADGSASAGSDYTASSGALTFSPGQVTKSVTVTVLGDSAVEGDEDFVVNLSGLTNATAGDLQGRGTILDDDAATLPAVELVHGSTQWADLAADPGPTADVDLYRLAQQPGASYEVVVDGTSGDLAPGLLLERLAADTVTVLQSAAPVGAGTSLSLRWENLVPAPVLGQYLRVGNALCGTACGVDDVYRISAWDTTYSIPRFNNSGTQSTVVVVQNAAGYPVVGRIYFRDGGGALLHTQAFGITPHGLYVLNTSSVPVLQGQGGTATVSSDGRYGDLEGKAVALEPSTGFTFDTPMTARPR
jgi:hypothetical protein